VILAAVLYGLGVYALMRDILDNGESVPRSVSYSLLWPAIVVVSIYVELKNKWASRKQ
jgi:NADH:ubiquinone oxidoreductase subunit 4 (subunit M)